jgi:hypothetical protein
MKEELEPYMARYHKTGRLDFPQEILDKIQAQHIKEKGKPLDPCKGCWADYIRELCRR